MFNVDYLVGAKSKCVQFIQNNIIIVFIKYMFIVLGVYVYVLYGHRIKDFVQNIITVRLLSFPQIRTLYLFTFRRVACNQPDY